jgi:hypothetical protein
VFVVKPEGWTTPFDANGLPRFYYAHKPGGSPTHLEFPGVAPTGALPERIDFPLHRQREREAFRAIVLADTQPYSLDELSLLDRDVIEELIGFEAAFGITLGDLVGDDLSLFEPLNRSIGRIGLPWYNAIGNHDLNFDAESDLDSDESFERVYGPTDYAFAYGKVHFIVLDDVVYAGAKPDGTPGPYEAGLSQQQLSFVSNYLATVPRDRLIVIAMHIPFASPPLELRERDALLALLQQHPHTLSLAGHNHYQEHRYYGADAAVAGAQPHHQMVVATASGSWWLGAEDELGIPHATMRCGAPNGYAIIEFDGSRYAIRFKAARRPPEHQMSIFSPDAASAASAAETEIVVNVFNGSERTRVEMRLAVGGDADAVAAAREVDGKGEPLELDEAVGIGDWIPLQREARADPFYLDAIERDLRRNPRPRFFLPPAIDSPHLWVGTLPANPPVGTHAIEVRAIDDHGELAHARRLIRID